MKDCSNKPSTKIFHGKFIRYTTLHRTHIFLLIKRQDTHKLHFMCSHTRADLKISGKCQIHQSINCRLELNFSLVEKKAINFSLKLTLEWANKRIPFKILNLERLFYCVQHNLFSWEWAKSKLLTWTRMSTFSFFYQSHIIPRMHFCGNSWEKHFASVNFERKVVYVMKNWLCFMSTFHDTFLTPLLMLQNFAIVNQAEVLKSRENY